MISLREINKENFWDVVSLNVSEDQRKFVASNAISLAQAYVQKELKPFAIYNDDQLVGFVMWCIDTDDGNYWIYRLMIDERYQNKHHGSDALNIVINEIKKDKNHNKVLLGVHLESVNAVKLYKSKGFKFNGLILDDEHIMQLDY